MAKIYTAYGTATDKNGVDHVVTVVGELTKERKSIFEVTQVSHNQELTTHRRITERKLTFGHSICNPEDEFNEEEGIRVAKRRVRKNPNGSLYSTDTTMLTEDACNMYVIHKLMYIIQHIDKFIERT